MSYCHPWSAGMAALLPTKTFPRENISVKARPFGMIHFVIVQNDLMPWHRIFTTINLYSKSFLLTRRARCQQKRSARQRSTPMSNLNLIINILNLSLNGTFLLQHDFSLITRLRNYARPSASERSRLLSIYNKLMNNTYADYANSSWQYDD